MSKTRILLTGADSLIGSHIQYLLLSRYEVSLQVVVRSREHAPTLHEAHQIVAPDDIAVVSELDLTRPGAYDYVLGNEANPFKLILHTATGTSMNEVDCLARFINLESESLIRFLESIHRCALLVDRVVLVTSLTPFARWLAEDAKHGRAGDNHSGADAEYILAASSASNNIVHDAVLHWFQRTKPRFDFVYITIPSCYGPATQTLSTSEDVLEANRRIWNICNNERRKSVNSVPFGLAPFTDVRDFADACIRSAFSSCVSNKRFMICGGLMPSDARIADFLCTRFPELRSNNRPTYGDTQTHESVLEEVPLDFDAVDTIKSLDLPQYRPIEDTLVDTTQQIIELQQRKEWRRVIRS